jgi:hypothetical protein
MECSRAIRGTVEATRALSIDSGAMRSMASVLMLMFTVAAATFAAAQAPPASKPSAPQPPASTAAAAPTLRIGTMSELMVHLIYPTSDAVFYISSRTPATEAEWTALQAQTLTLAESANLLMMPGRARDQDRWMADARLMLDAGRAAFTAAKAKDVAALEALSDQLLESCTTCHRHYRPDYGKRPPLR